jgi:hypothetical protein
MLGTGAKLNFNLKTRRIRTLHLSRMKINEKWAVIMQQKSILLLIGRKWNQVILIYIDEINFCADYPVTASDSHC